MSRSNPARFVLSVAAEVAAVVFIVSVLPRVDLRTSAGAAPTFGNSPHANESPPLLAPLATWPAADNRREAPTHETSYYQRRSQPAASPQTGRDLPPREPPPLISVDPARPDYVEQRLDRASQDLVNTVGSYVSQATTDLLQVQPPPQAASPLRTIAPPAYRSPSVTANTPSTPPAGSFSTAPALPSVFPTQPQPQPRPWVRY